MKGFQHMIPMLAGVLLLAAAPANPAASMSEVPILFNDHHVAATPNKLEHGRVLAALVKDGTVLVPLRAMFEQTGATVSYDASSKTVHVSKAGADVQVTVGVPEATINGEKRPLDVPPQMYKGTLVVPLRVISEGMGAYVEWVPDKQTVVVRYVTATPPPAPAATEAPATPAPATPTPAPTPVPNHNEIFVAGDYFISGKTYNEFSAGYRNTSSYGARVAGQFDLGKIPLMAEFNWHQYQYPHQVGVTTAAPNTPCDGFGTDAPQGDPGCMTTIGNLSSVYVPAFRVRENESEGRLGLKVLDPRIYVGIGWGFTSGNIGYPNMTGFGYGVEKLPDLDQQVSLYGSYWNYPNIRGTYAGKGTASSLPMQYSLQTYQIGGTLTFSKRSPLFFELGYLGDRGNAKANSVTPGYTHNGAYAGFGFNFNP